MSEPKPIQTEVKLVWGIQSPKPLEGLPAFRQEVELVIRETGYAYAEVVTPDSTTRILLEDTGETWLCLPDLRIR